MKKAFGLKPVIYINIQAAVSISAQRAAADPRVGPPPGTHAQASRRPRAMKRPCEDSSSAESDVEETIDVGSENFYPG